jgi:hypothetical protein
MQAVVVAQVAVSAEQQQMVVGQDHRVVLEQQERPTEAAAVAVALTLAVTAVLVLLLLAIQTLPDKKHTAEL